MVSTSSGAEDNAREHQLPQSRAYLDGSRKNNATSCGSNGCSRTEDQLLQCFSIVPTLGGEMSSFSFLLRAFAFRPSRDVRASNREKSKEKWCLFSKGASLLPGWGSIKVTSCITLLQSTPGREARAVAEGTACSELHLRLHKQAWDGQLLLQIPVFLQRTASHYCCPFPFLFLQNSTPNTGLCYHYLKAGHTPRGLGMLCMAALPKSRGESHTHLPPSKRCVLSKRPDEALGVRTWKLQKDILEVNFLLFRNSTGKGAAWCCCCAEGSRWSSPGCLHAGTPASADQVSVFLYQPKIFHPCLNWWILQNQLLIHTYQHAKNLGTKAAGIPQSQWPSSWALPDRE